jgi:hypothetical protein
LWLLLATWLVAPLAVGLVLRGSFGAWLWYAASITVPTFFLSVAAACLVTDPYVTWVESGRAWRASALGALGAVALAVTVTVVLRKSFLP